MGTGVQGLKHAAKVQEWSVLPDRLARNTDVPVDDLMPWTDVMRLQFAL